QLRLLDERLGSLRDLEERRQSVLESIASQGKLDPDLRALIEAAPTRARLEDLYLPYKPKRRSRADVARECGLEPLAERLLADHQRIPADEAQAFLRPADAQGEGGVADIKAALDGARDILAERFAERPDVLEAMGSWLWDDGWIHARVFEDKRGEGENFRDYFDHGENLRGLPSHRALALFRGRSLDILEVKLLAPEVLGDNGRPISPSLAEARVAAHLRWSHQGRAADDLIRRTVAWTWKVKLSLSLERDLLSRLREEAEQVAIKVFADNLRDLLLAAPAGPRVIMGLDPGIRTGVKVAVVDATGQLLETATVYPHEPRRDWDGALHSLEGLCRRHGVQLVAIGNGTASRETDRLAGDLLRRLDAGTDKVMVSEAGASVYSASEYASQELPQVDVSLRGAASIARRLQDPLAELVKIDPKAIGVGQYQHDLNQSQLARSLDAVVEDCVNRVGVDLNTASAPLLARVSGLSAATARSVVNWRNTNGAFASRADLLKVTGLGPKTFEQCAGFLRIRGGSNPLDMTGVHPETYPVVERILAHAGKPIEQVMGQAAVLQALRPELFANERFGVISVRDILQELEKPGRDPRPDFKVARLRDDVHELTDLRVGMQLEGTVSNVAAFGAFVDLGVHQDGLVHVSELSERFVRDAREVVRVGEVVRVRVLELDLARKRIALSLRPEGSGDALPARVGAPAERRPRPGRGSDQRPAHTALAAAFARLGEGKR
ncbi:MAG: Tex family protein, partial [Betaproteobacteria bacterium]